MTEFALGIDIGGTFTDVVALDLKSGRYETAKVLTTPENPQIGATDGVDKILKKIGDPKQIKRLIHATTLFSNALIERKGAKTGLITTMGFKDTLQLGRERFRARGPLQAERRDSIERAPKFAGVTARERVVRRDAELDGIARRRGPFTRRGVRPRSRAHAQTGVTLGLTLRHVALK